MGVVAAVKESINVPPAARRQIEQAERIYQEVYGPTDPPAETPAETAAPVETPPEAPAPVEQAAPAPVAEAPPPAPAEPPPAEKPKDWEAMYKSLKGKYNKEIIPLQNQLRSQAEQISSLQQVIASMESAAATVAPKESAPTSSQSRFITESDVEDYGEDTIDLVRRAAREENQSMVAQLTREIAELKQQLQGTSATLQKTERQKLFDALDESVPGWRETNRDEGFLNWLSEPDPYSGMVRHALLTKAFEANDAARVTMFFRGFLGEHAVVNEHLPAQETRRQPQVDLETLVAPGKPKEGSVRAQEGKRIWTTGEIRKFYRDVQDKRFVGREAERVRIERDIVAAGREGRVTA